MQFSYNVSEEQYRRAVKLRLRRSSGPRLFKIAMFWVFVLVCLLMLWTVVTRNAGTPANSNSTQSSDQGSDTTETSSPPASAGHAFLINVAPFLLIGGIWVFMLVRLVPAKLGKLYRKDPSMQGTYTLDVTPACLTIHNSAGLTSNMSWNLYESWLESKDLITLQMKSTALFLISLAGLSEPQRDELRSILTSVLPKK